jgi:hypothetical protein
MRNVEGRAFLNTQHFEYPSPGFKFTFLDFIDVANAMARRRIGTCCLYGFDLSKWTSWRGTSIMFQDTGDRALTGHATGSQCDSRISDIH